jgi:hypothetical protein
MESPLICPQLENRTSEYAVFIGTPTSDEPYCHFAGIIMKTLAITIPINSSRSTA